MSIADTQDLPGAKNVRLRATETALFVYCDLSQSFGPSSSGKTIVIASSSGNRPLGNSNAVLGLNLFTKSLEKRDLTETGIASLRTDAFTDVNDALSWRVEVDCKTLCMRVTFADIKEREASSGKSVLLATTSGNKGVGNTGIMCGFNMYRPTQMTFEPAALSESVVSGKTLKPGDTLELENGFTVHYRTATAVEVILRTTEEALKSTKVLSLPKDIRLDNGTTLVLHVGAVVAKRVRSASPGDSAPSSQSPLPAEENGKSHNCILSCQREENNTGALFVSLQLDPTKTSGRTGSAKSFAVSSSAGFRVLYDSSRQPLCRASVNAYRPAPPLDDELVHGCVKTILATHTDVENVTLKSLLGEVLETLQLQETHKDIIRNAVQEAAVGELKRIRSGDSQNSAESAPS